VKNTGDYASAGHRMPLYVVTATVFATWFGSETVLGIPATFLKEGLHGVVADPFGASLCLILVGLFFAVPLYRMQMLTIGDFYKRQYGRVVEVLVTLCIVASYLGWVAAQIKALGLVFNVVSQGAISELWGMWIGSLTVMVYTLFGGMLSVAITDFIQMIIIMVGMIYIGAQVSDSAGGVTHVVHQAMNTGKFHFWPAAKPAEIIAFFTAGITMMLGSIPQQDVFQRVSSADNEKNAGRASILGGVLYFGFAFVPMLLAFSATIIDPALVNRFLEKDPQQILPRLVLTHAPVIAQIMFFGALLSAIKSCASATLLAPSVTFAENIVRGFYPVMTDKQLLKLMRWVVLIFTLLVTVIAVRSASPIFQMVENAYKVTLVTAFIPLICGLYWSRTRPRGGLWSVLAGGGSWIFCEIFYPNALLPPQLVGLLFSLGGMIIGSYWPVAASDKIRVI
jgi:Na+/proline symporter